MESVHDSFEGASARPRPELARREWRLLLSLADRRASIARAYASIGVRLEPGNEFALLRAQCIDLEALLRVRKSSGPVERHHISQGDAA